ncbi:hypothetical protein MLD38_036623 [Melastoma candidum]|uniref:Uncharacterized protein n=1 Tax=Melastoma candidum TaxID=119954 RepID=A0ACB9LM51_9MYRT|nr:hypothetical protein MLD38_036623 [Melastoma candidum]
MPQLTGVPKKDPDRLGCKLKSVDGTYSELVDFVCNDSTTPRSRISTGNSKSQREAPYELLSTSELISAVTHVWDCTSRCLGGSSQKAYPNHKFSYFSSGECNSGTWRLGDFDGNFEAGSPASHLSSEMQTRSNLDLVQVSRVLSLLRYGDKAGQSLLQYYLGNGSFSYRPWERRGPSCCDTTNGLRKMYGWMSKLIPVSSCTINNIHKVDTALLEENSRGLEACVESKHLASDHGIEEVTDAADCASLLSEQSLDLDNGTEEKNSISETMNSVLTSDHTPKPVPLESDEVDPCHDRRPVIEQPKVQQANFNKISIKETDKLNLQACSKQQGPFARQEHAFAGAFSGIFVSICLHPVDTIKTVTQSCRVEQRSLRHIGESIVSDRGFTGLYRGISSNIASSAPISAIYTFTYESVKRSLLPLFPKEYYSIAHCVAGGSASIATSFVFTPSERIKQQMQVDSRYQNCWNALLGIIRNGGLRSLYAGWGAVLCRNIPHSIIKFYIYENLKMRMFSPLHSGVPLNTIQTLVCGGIAGSTAALFTTPFDVVKTRLQTQKPGTASRYNGVLQALLEIGRTEGLKGLYRGLTPRLIMYVSQGSLFFASYEFFKQLFSLDEPQPEVHLTQCEEGDPRAHVLH